jgi:hypothetical protein
MFSVQNQLQHLQWPASFFKLTTVASVVPTEARRYRYEPLQFEGVKIYWRPDLFELTPENLQLLQMGHAPLGLDNEKINLHHLTQTDNGPLAMMLNTVHQQREVPSKKITAPKLPLQALLNLTAPLSVKQDGVEYKRMTEIIHNIFPKSNQRLMTFIAEFFKEQRLLNAQPAELGVLPPQVPGAIARMGRYPKQFNHQSVNRQEFNEFKQRFWQYLYTEIIQQPAVVFPETTKPMLMRSSTTPPLKATSVTK